MVNWNKEYERVMKMSDKQVGAEADAERLKVGITKKENEADLATLRARGDKLKRQRETADASTTETEEDVVKQTAEKETRAVNEETAQVSAQIEGLTVPPELEPYRQGIENRLEELRTRTTGAIIEASVDEDEGEEVEEEPVILPEEGEGGEKPKDDEITPEPDTASIEPSDEENRKEEQREKNIDSIKGMLREKGVVSPVDENILLRIEETYSGELTNALNKPKDKKAKEKLKKLVFAKYKELKSQKPDTITTDTTTPEPVADSSSTTEAGTTKTEEEKTIEKRIAKIKLTIHTKYPDEEAFLTDENLQKIYKKIEESNLLDTANYFENDEVIINIYNEVLEKTDPEIQGTIANLFDRLNTASKNSTYDISWTELHDIRRWLGHDAKLPSTKKLKTAYRKVTGKILGSAETSDIASPTKPPAEVDVITTKIEEGDPTSEQTEQMEKHIKNIRDILTTRFVDEFKDEDIKEIFDIITRNLDVIKIDNPYTDTETVYNAFNIYLENSNPKIKGRVDYIGKCLTEQGVADVHRNIIHDIRRELDKDIKDGDPKPSAEQIKAVYDALTKKSVDDGKGKAKNIEDETRPPEPEATQPPVENKADKKRTTDIQYLQGILAGQGITDVSEELLIKILDEVKIPRKKDKKTKERLSSEIKSAYEKLSNPTDTGATDTTKKSEIELTAEYRTQILYMFKAQYPEFPEDELDEHFVDSLMEHLDSKRVKSIEEENKETILDEFDTFIEERNLTAIGEILSQRGHTNVLPETLRQVDDAINNRLEAEGRDEATPDEVEENYLEIVKKNTDSPIIPDQKSEKNKEKESLLRIRIAELMKEAGIEFTLPERELASTDYLDAMDAVLNHIGEISYHTNPSQMTLWEKTKRIIEDATPYTVFDDLLGKKWDRSTMIIDNEIPSSSPRFEVLSFRRPALISNSETLASSHAMVTTSQGPI
jgi:hypothetical protein